MPSFSLHRNLHIVHMSSFRHTHAHARTNTHTTEIIVVVFFKVFVDTTVLN